MVRASSRRASGDSRCSCSARLLAAPVSTASGVRRSCEMDASSELRSRSEAMRSSALPARPRRSARARAPARSVRANVSSSRCCSGDEDQPLVARRKREHAAVAHRCAQRQVVDGGARERVRAEAGRLLAVVHPLRHRQVRLAQLAGPLAGAGCTSLPWSSGSKHRRRRLEHAVHVLHGDLQRSAPRSARRKARGSSAYSEAARRSRCAATRA